MRKILRKVAFAAAIALPALAVSAQEFKVETVWGNVQKGDNCNPVPELTGNWGGKTTPQNQVCARFGVGKDGKILTTDHTKNAIIAIGPNNSVEVYKQLNPVTAEKWNGTVMTTDDAGNVIFNYNFTDPSSARLYGVLDKNKNITDVEISAADAAALGMTGRLDNIGHIIGDVTSAEGGIGYIALQKQTNVWMLHFTGDGTKVTKVVATKSATSISALTNQGDPQACEITPKYSTVKETLAQPAPADQYYIAIGVKGPNANGNTPSYEAGFLGQFNGATWTPLEGYGNRGYQVSAKFELGGKSYIVRNYISDAFLAEKPVYTSWKQVMNFGIFEVGTGKCVASWMGSDFASVYGFGTLTAEKVDDNTVNIYTYVCTGSTYNQMYDEKGNLLAGADEETKTRTGAYCAMVKVSLVGGASKGSGTASDPYQIATAEDLCNAWKLMEQGKQTYFVQTADIDLAGVTDWYAFNGFNGVYDRAVSYDGQNHVIKNFKPVAGDVTNAGDNRYYSTTLFGVLQGTVKNLGVVDANVAPQSLEGGILAGFFGGNWVPGIASSLENVYVTGKNVGPVALVGGMFGTTAADVTITNCYANVEVGSANPTAQVAGMIASLGNLATVKDSYVVVNSITGTTKNLVANTGTKGEVDATNVYAFGEGNVTDGVTKAALGDAAAIAAIQKLPAFNEGKLYKGYPALNVQTLVDVKQDGTAENPYIIATAEDLCNAWSKTEPNKLVHFLQTEDIDMEGVTDWIAINGYQGGFPSAPGSTTYLYNSAIVYDGGNHVIKNFAPTDKAAVAENKSYYCCSLFGVLAGEVKNLGLENVTIKSTGGNLGAGVLAGYFGHGNAASLAPVSKITNVYVSGTIENSDAYCGGFVGTNATACEITNSYAQVNITSTNGWVAGMVGRARNNNQVKVTNSYFAGTITSNLAAEKKGLLFSTDKASGVTVNLDNVVAFGEGKWGAEDLVYDSEDAKTVKNVTVAPAKDAAAIAIIKGWAAFNEGKVYNGYPALNWQSNSGAVEDIVADEIEDVDAPVVYYNLNGVRVENPAQGIYIKKQGNKVSKVVIR